MKSKVRLLNLVVSFTLILLTIGAVLVVLGIFNAALDWDIFGPKLESILYGIFGSCMALAIFGVAMVVIIAMQESVRDFKRLVQARTNQQEAPDAPKRTYVAKMFMVVAVMTFLIVLCAGINHVVLAQRCKVFKRLSGEQIAGFQSKIAGVIETFYKLPQERVPRELYDVIKTIDDLDFVKKATLYIPDSSESNAMWRFQCSYTNTDGFVRFYVAKDFEKAMRSAMDGNLTDMSKINSRNEFIWYRLISGTDGKAKAVVRIDGDSHKSFREYRLGR